jgi:release factor glutamine methyltransferase
MSRCIGDLITSAVAQGVDRLDAEVLLYRVLGKARTFLIAWPEKELTAAQHKQYISWLSRRQVGEPIAHIVGEREFWSLAIKTTTATLIPRPDTEVLVEAVLDFCAAAPLDLIDLGTGTGAIALALKSERPMWRIKGVDRVPEAVNLARENAERLQLDVEFELSSWCDAVADQSVDVIVSNPPYIDETDRHLDEGDVRFEPKSALVSADNGLADIKLITQQALRCLKPQGALFFEHGWSQANDVKAIMRETGFKKIRTLKDYGDNDRVTLGTLS